MSSRILQIHCEGTPYEIGFQHGSRAESLVRGSLGFYKGLFSSTCSMTWEMVRLESARFAPELKRLCPKYLTEMEGIAAGAAVDILDIIALNVRTEIAFGLFTLDQAAPPSDGCTSMAHKAKGTRSILAQNWDWMVEQSPNIFICHIHQPDLGLPDISTVTEGGIIGKIGMNSAGVGVCLNAIRARGLDRTRLPIHLALRTVLESTSRKEAIDRLKSQGVAGSGHILVADPSGATGMEWTSVGVQLIEQDNSGLIVHANHLVREQVGVDEPHWLDDSFKRQERMTALLQNLDLSRSLSFEEVHAVFKDEDGYPNSIDRCQLKGGLAETVFNIIMDCTSATAFVTFGRVNSGRPRILVEPKPISGLSEQ